MRELPPQVEEWLRRDGWYPGRVDDKTDWAALYRQAGMEPPEAVLAFHREFGSLVLNAPRLRIGLHPRWKIPWLVPSAFRAYLDFRLPDVGVPQLCGKSWPTDLTRLKEWYRASIEAVSTLVGPVGRVGTIMWWSRMMFTPVVEHPRWPDDFEAEPYRDDLLMDAKANFYWVDDEANPPANIFLWARGVQDLLCDAYNISSRVRKAYGISSGKGLPQFVGSVVLPYEEDTPSPHDSGA